MDANARPEIELDTPFFRIYKDGRADRLVGTRTVPPGHDADTGVTSKDVVIDGDTGVYVRLYLPETATRPGDDDSTKKLPVLLYFHGGGFVTDALKRAGLPEHPLPAGYDDSFSALKWAVSGSGGDPWLSEHGDLGRVFLAGDSAGGNIVHNVAMMATRQDGDQDSDLAARIERAALLHAAFGGSDPVAGETPELVALTEKLWRAVCPEAAGGPDDPRMNPLVAAAAPSLRDLPCKRVLVCAAEADFLRPRCRAYYEGLAASGWDGAVEWFESMGQPHVFFLHNSGSDEAVAFMGRLVAFFTQT
ncbi:hypothetical protein QOZ80_6BG0491090 [Eleusine coracana subsp. coracana]|nr:hypothetical protein QOZ80_6BG0491090 [Eleusine coracana subsp. coracana]